MPKGFNWEIKEEGEFVTLAEWKRMYSTKGREKAKRLNDAEVRLCIEAYDSERYNLYVDASGDRRGIVFVLEELLALNSALQDRDSYEAEWDMKGKVRTSPDLYQSKRFNGPWEDEEVDLLEYAEKTMEGVNSIVELVVEVLGEAEGIPDDELAKLKEIAKYYTIYK